MELYRVYVTSSEEEEHYNSAISLWVPMMENAGRDFRQNLAISPNINDVPKSGYYEEQL